jgi:hypothetical protein
MLDPPYLVDRPDTFPPALLSVNVLNVDGLNPKSTWIVKVVVEGVTQTLRLGWNQDDASFEPRNSNTMRLQWQVPESSIDLQMDMMVYEQRRSPRQQRRRRLKTTLPVPLTFLDATATSDAARSRFVVVPVDDASSLTLSINFQSDFALWLQQEVDARKKEEVSRFKWTAPFFKPQPEAPPVVETAISNTYSFYPFALCCAW